jgi:hypothetical protein
MLTNISEEIATSMLKVRIIDTIRIPRGEAIFQDGWQDYMEGRVNTRKVKISLLQVVDAPKFSRGRGSNIN